MLFVKNSFANLYGFMVEIVNNPLLYLKLINYNAPNKSIRDITRFKKYKCIHNQYSYRYFDLIYILDLKKLIVRGSEFIFINVTYGV